MLSIFSILWIVNLDGRIMVINTTRVIIFIIIIIITIMAKSHKKSVLFMIKKIVALISIESMSNRKKKNFRDKTENFIKIKTNIIYFWLIIKGIYKMTLIILIKNKLFRR